MPADTACMGEKTRIPLANVMDLMVDAICVVDRHGRFLFVSAAFEGIFGYAPDEVIGRNMIDLVFPSDRERTLRVAEAIMAGVPQPHFENRYVRKDGKIVHIMWSARWSEADQARIAVARDITELKHAQRMQAALFEISEAASTAEDLGALCKRTHHIIGELLPARNFFVALHDVAKDELSFPYFVDEHDPPPATRKFDSGTLSAEVIRSGQALLLTPDSDIALPGRVQRAIGMDPIDWLGVPLHTSRGVIGALVVQSYSGDVRYTEQDKALLQFVSNQVAVAIERKQAETLLQHTAQHDPLTDLPNRAFVLDRLQASLARARREDQPLALLYLDFDDFKQVNDAFGHSVGDMLLSQVAHRMRGCVRDSDTVGRMGGDEFMLVLRDIDPERAAAVAEKIRAALEQPFMLAGRRVSISVSIGMANWPGHGDDSAHLIEHADRAMYAAKRNGGNRVLVAGLGD
jgi:diguanylate cyclase (GGDEF)-like protein/PAS domain S-box-containing protein